MKGKTDNERARRPLSVTLATATTGTPCSRPAWSPATSSTNTTTATVTQPWATERGRVRCGLQARPRAKDHGMIVRGCPLKSVDDRRFNSLGVVYNSKNWTGMGDELLNSVFVSCAGIRQFQDAPVLFVQTAGGLKG
jgi:hypothetical protein